MSEQFQGHDSLPAASAEQDVAAAIKKIQQQLVSLEKKIDILINRSSGRPSSERHFSKPFRSFSHPHRSFDKEHRGFDPTKKPFYHKRRERG